MGVKSVSVIGQPEFINLQPFEISPFISSCEIKVLYTGNNRNHTSMSKEVVTEMAKTLRGNPIVGFFKEDKEDFTDHGDQIIIDGDGIQFKCLTKPYGFVAPDAKVWFQDFQETNDDGTIENRTYLMTNGYLWTGQFEECKVALEEGRPQSMELDNDTCQGNWTKDNKSGIEFFIVSDAIFSKLCILGEDVEPCFEGANITAPSISTSFTKDNQIFANTLYSMMNELKFALRGGNQQMENNNKDNLNNNEPVAVSDVTNPAVTDFVNKEDENDKEKKNSNKEESNSSSNDNKTQDNKDKKDDEEEKKKYALLEQQYQDLTAKYQNLENEYKTLYSFKESIENKEKDNLIAQFYMLNDEDKKDVIENKSKYSLEEIESKLSVICYRKKINFAQPKDNDNSTQEALKEPITTFSLGQEDSSVPAYIKALQRTKSRENI